jgi:hypothetical protein
MPFGFRRRKADMPIWTNRCPNEVNRPVECPELNIYFITFSIIFLMMGSNPLPAFSNALTAIFWSTLVTSTVPNMGPQNFMRHLMMPVSSSPIIYFATSVAKAFAE